MNTLEVLLTSEELVLYERAEYPFNLSILHNALKLKLQEDPSYEVFVPLVYYRHVTFLKSNKWAVIKPHQAYISNRGQVCRIRYDEVYNFAIRMDDEYPKVRITFGRKNRQEIKLHRALACAFIPVPDKLGGTHPKYLQVNHLDGDKLNYPLDNLEWVTPLDNVQHALDNRLIKSKPVKGLVMTGPFTGHAFILLSRGEGRKYGFGKQQIGSCFNGRQKTYSGCTWSTATEEEITSLPRGITEDIQNSLKQT